MNLFRVLIDHWIVWNKTEVGFSTLASNQDQNQKLSHARYLLPISRPWHRLHVLDTNYTFLALDTDYKFSRAWHRLQVFPHLAPITSFPLALASISRFLVLATDYTFSALGDGCVQWYCRFELVSLRYFVSTMSVLIVYINDNSHTYREQYRKTLELGIIRTASWILRNRTLK